MVKPSELGGIDSAPSVQSEHRRTEVDTVDLGLLEFGTAVLIAFGPEADALTRSSSSRTTGTLRRRGATDAAQLPAVDTSLRVVADSSGDRKSVV